MSEGWIKSSEKVLDWIKRFEAVEGKDRLELVRSIHFMLGALQRSLFGWTKWVNDPEIMVQFTQEELVEMNKNLAKFLHSFIEYDLEATKLENEKEFKVKRKRAKRKERKIEWALYIR